MSNGPVFVYNLSDSEKNVVGAVGTIVVLLLCGFFAFQWLFPSEDSMRWDSHDVKSHFENDLRAFESHVPGLEARINDEKLTINDAAEIGDIGEDLNFTHSFQSQAESNLRALEKYAAKFQRSDNVELRAEGVGLEKFNTESREKFEALSTRLQKAEEKLANLVPKKE